VIFVFTAGPAFHFAVLMHGTANLRDLDFGDLYQHGGFW
jgi:hypothetical protein